jgi:hypothetical protein
LTKRALQEQLHRDQVLASRALGALMLNELPDDFARKSIKRSTTGPDT